MLFTVQKLNDVPVILLSLTSEYNFLTDFPKSYAAVSELLASVDKPVYYITDLSASAFDLEMIMQAAEKTSLNSGGTFHHPMVKEVLIVSPSEAIHYAAEGLQTEIYGKVQARAFYSLEDAMKYIRAHC